LLSAKLLSPFDLENHARRFDKGNNMNPVNEALTNMNKLTGFQYKSYFYISFSPKFQ
jgi:hypothetical protein